MQVFLFKIVLALPTGWVFSCKEKCQLVHKVKQEWTLFSLAAHWPQAKWRTSEIREETELRRTKQESGVNPVLC